MEDLEIYFDNNEDPVTYIVNYTNGQGVLFCILVFNIPDSNFWTFFLLELSRSAQYFLYM